MEKGDQLRWLFLEASTSALSDWVSKIRAGLGEIRVHTHPRKVLSMAVAVDSLSGEPFCLGEILFTECEVVCRGQRFWGRALLDDSFRAFASALLEAAMAMAPNVLDDIKADLTKEKERLEKLRQKNARVLGSTRVLFETMKLT